MFEYQHLLIQLLLHIWKLIILIKINQDNLMKLILYQFQQFQVLEFLDLRYVCKFSQGDVVIPGSVTANSFVKSGGTSSQYLMADGSVSTGGSTFNGGTVANATTFSSNVTVNGKLRIPVAWDSGTLENNAIYAKNSTDGFGFGNGTNIYMVGMVY